jgi:hypothetical protein
MWIFIAAGGEVSLVPVATSGGPVLLPVRAEGPDGMIGDGAIEIFPGHPLYEQRLAEIEWEQRLRREWLEREKAKREKRARSRAARKTRDA